jgi:hypothetical protein
MRGPGILSIARLLVLSARVWVDLVVVLAILIMAALTMLAHFRTG